jgi:hypothetical protein
LSSDTSDTSDGPDMENLDGLQYVEYNNPTLGRSKIIGRVDNKVHRPLLSSFAILVGLLWMMVILTMIRYRLRIDRMLAYFAYKEFIQIVVEEIVEAGWLVHTCGGGRC